MTDEVLEYEEVDAANPPDLGYRPRPPQLDIHHAVNRNRFTVVVAHRRMGKTVSAILHLINAALNNEQKDPRYAYIAPTYAQAKRVAFDYLVEYTRPLGAKVNIAELRVDFLGRRISLYGSENGDSLRGQYFDGVVLDEIGDQNPKIWNEIIRPALADRRGWCLFIGTPKGNNHFADFKERAQKTDGWQFLEFKASETGILDHQELAAAKAEMGEDKYRQEFECSFDAPVEGAYYGQLLNEADEQNRVTTIPKDNLARIVCSWDLGVSDSTCIWVAQIVGKEVQLIDATENHGVGLDYYVSWLRERGYDKGQQILPHDVRVREMSSGKSRQEVLMEAGLDVTIAPSLSVADGIQAVRRLLPRCWFDAEGTKQGLSALRNYRRVFDEKRNVFFDTPLHDWASHYADSFRYMAIGLNEVDSDWGKPINVNNKWVV
jgi:phage terminase large subunit